jgi:hypothetical protein
VIINAKTLRKWKDSFARKNPKFQRKRSHFTTSVEIEETNLLIERLIWDVFSGIWSIQIAFYLLPIAKTGFWKHSFAKAAKLWVKFHKYAFEQKESPLS